MSEENHIVDANKKVESATGSKSAPNDGSVSHKFYPTAWKKIQRLQEDGLKCVEVVFESEDGKTAHVDRWGKVTWDR